MPHKRDITSEIDMTKPLYPDLNDDLSDLLGGEARTAPLPQDPGLVRAREAAESFTETCPKCRGTGRFIGWSGRQLGECFACKGKGSKSFKTAPQVRQQARQRTAVAKATVIADHQEELKWLYAALQRRDRLPEGYGNLLADLHERLSAGRELTDGQMAVVRKGMARTAEWKARQSDEAYTRATQNTLDVTAIREVLQSRKKVMVALFTFSLAPAHGNNPGAIYVKDNGQYVGKIPAGASTFRPGRDFDQSRLPALREAMANPAEAVKADAARRAKLLLENPDMSIPCGCCGIMLTNPESIRRGIGPICAGKWGF
jgi:hypothetical protein